MDAKQIREALEVAIDRCSDQDGDEGFARCIRALLDSGFLDRAIEYAEWQWSWPSRTHRLPRPSFPKDWPAGLATDTMLVRAYRRLAETKP